MNQKVFTWISAIVSLLYIVFGVYIVSLQVMYFTYQKAFGGLLIGYGLFRMYRVYRLYLKRKENEEE